MGQIIIKCPDGKLALWSTVVDAFITPQMGRKDMIHHLAENAKVEVRDRVDRAIENDGECVHDITYEEACETQIRVHGDGGRAP